MGTRQTITLPNKESLVKGKEVATTIEAAEYFENQFESRLRAAGKLEEAQPALDNIHEFVEMVRNQRESRGDPWSGVPGPLNDFQNLQQNRAEKAAKKAGLQIDGNLVVEFAVNDSSEMRRAFSIVKKDVESGKVKKEALDPETRKELDKIMQAVLAEENLVSKGSVIYQGDEKGQIRRDSKGEPVLADVEKAKQVLSDAAHQVENYFKEAGKGDIKVEVKERAYPQQPTVSKAQAPESAPTVTPEVTPEVSSAPQASGPSA
ncbi:hypothetical protein [Legionella hackeliae]|uniref:Substrate of the Dot/Icm secretion system n=1 Tax=Legionella hackeliae TaxID=449 RepID=A0A0A8UKL9_LEGHA|nr:hypothetical protein [Legionella hackeliae]KTD13572.1 substrate of the Dot/Icm secretion system [Legionella hackeliae]CEK09420.1 protein of unknown function [Legionella hackeliae]STX49328.1 Dot/Icm secretion system substrate [Legionella hackeliae]